MAFIITLYIGTGGCSLGRLKSGPVAALGELLPRHAIGPTIGRRAFQRAVAPYVAPPVTQLGGQQHAHTRHPRVLAQRGDAAVDGGSGGGGHLVMLAALAGLAGLAVLTALAALAALSLARVRGSLLGLPRDCIPLDDIPRPRALQPQLGRLVGVGVSSQG